MMISFLNVASKFCSWSRRHRFAKVYSVAHRLGKRLRGGKDEAKNGTTNGTKDNLRA